MGVFELPIDPCAFGLDQPWEIPLPDGMKHNLEEPSFQVLQEADQPRSTQVSSRVSKGSGRNMFAISHRSIENCYSWTGSLRSSIDSYASFKRAAERATQHSHHVRSSTTSSNSFALLANQVCDQQVERLSGHLSMMNVSEPKEPPLK